MIRKNKRAAMDIVTVFTRLNKFRGTTPPWPPKYFYPQYYLPEGFCWLFKTKIL